MAATVPVAVATGTLVDSFGCCQSRIIYLLTSESPDLSDCVPETCRHYYKAICEW